MKKNNIITISIGIPAYNEAANIENLLRSILQQKKGNYRIHEIFVVSDGSTDETTQIAKKVKNNLIRVISSPLRKGKYFRLNQIIKMATSSYLFVIDADCVLAKDCLSQITESILNGDDSPLFSAKAIPIEPSSHVEKILYTSISFKEKIIEKLHNGKNVYAFRGSLLGLPEKLYRIIKIPDTIGTDAFIYFTARKLGIGVKYVPEAKIYYRLPQSMKDHVKQSTRFFNSRNKMEDIFGEWVKHEYKIPTDKLLKVIIQELLINPIGILSYSFVFTYSLFRKNLKVTNSPAWEIAYSTKKLIHAPSASTNYLSKKKKKVTVTVGIPTFNAQENILEQLNSLLNQDSTNFVLQSIIVHDDRSSDKTIDIIKKLKNKKIKLIVAPKRKGFANGVKRMMKINRSELLILLNDDVKIIDPNFLSELVTAYQSETNVGLVSGNPQPMNPNTFIEKAGISTFRAYERVRYYIRDGNNKHTSDGKVLGFSQKFIKSLKFPKNDNELGNVDSFLYFSCLKYGFTYRHARNAKVYFVFPSTLKEYISWTTRNNMNRHMLKKQFGDIVDKEFAFPKFLYVLSLTIEFLKNPFGGLFIYSVGQYCKFKSKRNYSEFSSTWDVISSTKRKLS